MSVADVPNVDYMREVKPLLAARCYACHAAIKQKGSLRVDTAASLREGGNNGAAVTPGDGKGSILIQRVLGQGGKKRMPPEHDGEALKPAEVALLLKWIDQGAHAPKDEQPETDPADHWAFKKPTRPSIPKVRNVAWVRNAIDAYIAESHEKQGLVPQPEVDKRLLLRRVYLDLIGLPPTQQETEAFLSDASTDAYEKVVDRLLASPQYGERWGRHWMDIWRYSDWWGLGAEMRNSQKHMWHWRDWIVESLNKDKGYEQMLREMLAADELYPTDADKLRGTGFLARHYFKFNRTTWLDETIEHTGKAFLGLTMNCSKCHDHKYDPITHVDYYRFRAFFEPYQIRLDQTPGETDFEKDGIPRVFDCNLDTKTFLHIRGNEGSPDKARKITPGLPKILAAKDLDISPINLPPEGHNPGLRPYVLKDHIAAYEKQLAAAKFQLARAEELVANVKETKAEITKKPTSAGDNKVILTDTFTTLMKERWTVGSGKWESGPGGVSQTQDLSERAALNLKVAVPQDFEATAQVTILGGNIYKSVGIAFDIGKDHETLVYLTAHAPSQRVQVAYKVDGKYVYPADAGSKRAVPLNKPQELTIRVRGDLLNIAINGEHTLAYILPKGRHPGSLDLITFDAQARFSRFALAELHASTPLLAATGKPASSPTKPATPATAKAMLLVAQKQVASLTAQIAAVDARAAADRILATEPSKAKDFARKAALAEKQKLLAESELALAKAQEDLGKGKIDIKKAQAAVDTARKALAAPGESYARLPGALKTLESNLESDASRRKPFPTTSTGRRTALAQWVASKDNPLTARVAVNHIWARHFGQPLVATVFDFGRKGAAPTHPALLDWLAVELMDNGWSMKHLHRLMVTSSAYRMTSSLAGAAASNKEKDPDNRYLWHMNPQRMESQVVRDSLLHLAGELDGNIGGPSVPIAQQDASKRRSLYFFHSAIDRNRFLTTFDDADPLDCYRRRESIVPQQALALSNSKLALNAADKIAKNLDVTFGKANDRDFARTAFSLLLAQNPTDDELSACEKAMIRWRELHAKDGGQRARMLLVHALLNHNEFVTVR